MPTTPNNLYSASLELRYQATVASGETSLSSTWPMACGGAGNAYLALIGPSMGGAGKGEVVARGGVTRPRGKRRRVGINAMNFDWGDHRKARWTRLCAEILGGEQYVLALTALLNLDWRHSSDERAIPEADLERGWQQHILPLLSEVRPRIICALTNLVWDIVKPAAEVSRVPLPDCPFQLARDPVAFRIRGCDFTTLLVKPHNHPSRFLRNDQMVTLGQVCRWFITESA